VAENIAACTARNAETGCLEWVGAIDKRTGYGTYGGRGLGAHRVAYEEAKGPIPPGMLVCHTCDNPRCVEPAHLFLGTNYDNTIDCLRKGRHFSGKLTEEQVRAIRADTRSQTKIAADYGVSTTSIRRLRSGRTWRHVA